MSLDALANMDSSIAQLVIPLVPEGVKFTGFNTLHWSKYLEMILDGKSLTHHLTKEANKSDGNFTTWKPTDATVKAWLVGSMKLEFLNNYLLLPTTKTVWDKVNK